MNTTLTAERLREVLSYDPDTGIFTWRIPRKKCAVGMVAGSPEIGRYIRIKIDYELHYAHRLAWLYMTGLWPACQVDHRNLDKSDNRWVNLREATPKQNSENVKPRSKSGCRGIDFHSRSRLWRVRITHNLVRQTIGYFKTMEEAITAREAAERKFFTHSKACEPQPSCHD